MGIKMMEGDKEVKFMTLEEVAKQLDTTVKEIKELAKKTYLPIYPISTGRVSSGDLDFIKEKLKGNLDIEFTGCCVQMQSDGIDEDEIDWDNTTDYEIKKELPTFDAFIKELKLYNKHHDDMYKKHGDTYGEGMLAVSRYLEIHGFLDCTEAGNVIGGTNGEIGQESRWILEEVKGNKYIFRWYSDWDPDFIPTHAYACMPEGQKDINKLRLVDLKIEEVNIDEVDGCYDKIFTATYIKDKDEGDMRIPLRNKYKWYAKFYNWEDEDTHFI